MISSAARIILGLYALTVGMGYMLGQQYCDADEFAVVRSLGLPSPVWCAVLVLAVDHGLGVSRRSQSRVDARAEHA